MQRLVMQVAAAVVLASTAAIVCGDETPSPPAPPPAPCPAAAIPHAKAGCAEGLQGTECKFECEPGFIGVGRHVCQSYITEEGTAPILNEYFGGRCVRLCENRDCAYATAVRSNSSNGTCLVTRCMDADDALRQLARGAYSVWNLGRNPTTGIHVGKVDPSADASAQGDRAHIGINGVALIMECVATEMGWISRAEAQSRVLLSLRALAGELPGFTLARQKKHGWIPTFFNASTGAEIGRGGPHTGGTGYTTLDSGLNAQGVLFARTYFTGTASKDKSDSAKHTTAEIARLAKKIFNLVRFEHLLCDLESSQQDDQGTAAPFTFDDAGGCAGLQRLQPDGAYEYSELHYTVDLAFHQACVGQPSSSCANKPIAHMWEAWQRRKLSPIHNYTSPIDGKVYPLLSLWSSYIVHLPYFSTSSFNADPHWSALFASHWAADWAYYNSSAFYGGDGGRYGLAAGFTDPACSAKGGGYEADMIVQPGSRQDVPGAQGCRLFSPYAVAGYLPANAKLIASHLLELLATGEAVSCRFGCLNSTDFFMLRSSLLEPEFNIDNGVSMVDFASELFGLASYFLPEFFHRFTKHDWVELANLSDAREEVRM
jgi:hypothetical protein